MRFWDSSALLPLCLEEPFSANLKEAASGEGLVVWWASSVECLSAMARLRREGWLSEAGERQAHALLSILSASWTEILPSNLVREKAGRALSLHSLTASDALQLGAALVWARGHAMGHGFVCLDRRLREAAAREGFDPIPAAL